MVSDDFNRADADALGGSWTEVAGDIDIVSNSARLGVEDISSYARYEVDVGSSDMYVEAVVVALQNHFTQFDVAARFQDAATTFYAGRIIFRSTSPNTFHRIVKITAGAETPLTSEVSYSRTLPDTVRIEAVTVGGNVELTLFIDGVQVASATDSSSPILTGQRAGMAMFSSHPTTSAWPRVDSWSADAMAGGSEDYSGGSTATVTAAASGAGTSHRSGGSTATVTSVVSGAGGKGSPGSSEATVTAMATGSGTSGRAGGADATVTAAASGAGTSVRTGASQSTVTVTATGAGSPGVPEFSGGSTATVTVTATGGGLSARSSGSAATVTSSPTGAGVTARRGGSAASVVVTVTGGGFSGEPPEIPPAIRVTVPADLISATVEADQIRASVPASRIHVEVPE